LLVEGILPREKDEKVDVSNYQLLKEFVFGISVLAQFVSDRQQHPDDISLQDKLKAEREVTCIKSRRHDELCSKFDDIMSVVEDLRTEVVILKIQVEKKRATGSS
jgi:hypothetical protein